MNKGEMTLRDYFAAKSIASVYKTVRHDAVFLTRDEILAEMGREAYKIADAMMKAREVDTDD